MRVTISPTNTFQRFLNIILTPHWIVILTVTVSAIAWLLPESFGFYQGFKEKEPLSFHSFFLIALWYSIIFITTYYAFYIGGKVKLIHDFDVFVPLKNSSIFIIISCIAFLGFFYSLTETIRILGVSGFINAVTTFQTNKIAYAIYNDYSIGLFSLRYVLILSFGVTLYRIFEFKKVRNLDLINIIVFVFYIAFFGRRLQLVCSIIVFLCIANRKKEFLRKINLRKLFFIMIFGATMLIVATVLRNYGTYQERGFNNPVIATVANIVEYLASPFQVSVGIGNNLNKAIEGIFYRKYVDIDSGLVTNSAFADIIIADGLWAFFNIFLTSLIFGFLAGFLSKNKDNYLFLGYPIILYAFAEVWRIELFNKGIFYTLLFAGVGIPFIYTCLWLIFYQKKKNFG